MTPETIFQAITRGSMRLYVEDVQDDVKRAMKHVIIVGSQIKEHITEARLIGVRPLADIAPLRGPDRVECQPELRTRV